MSLPNAIEVVTLFVDDIGEAKAFYAKVFEPRVLFQDDVSCVLKFEGAMVICCKLRRRPTGAAHPCRASRVGRAYVAHDQGRGR